MLRASPADDLDAAPGAPFEAATELGGETRLPPGILGGEGVNGRSGISPEMAIRLDKAFGGGAATWYRLQSAYDLAQAMKNAGRIDVERIPTPV